MTYLIANYFDKVLMVLIILPPLLLYVAVVIRDIIINHIVNSCYNLSTYDFKDIYTNKENFYKELENNTTFKNVILYFNYKKGLKD